MYEPGFIYGKGGVKIAKVGDLPSGGRGRAGGRGRGGFRRGFSLDDRDAREGSARRRSLSDRSESPPQRGPGADRWVASLLSHSLVQHLKGIAAASLVCLEMWVAIALMRATKLLRSSTQNHQVS